jgi:hypothetical protein
MFTIIALPENFVTDISTNATDVVGSLSPFITLVTGVLLATVVITLLINALRHH